MKKSLNDFLKCLSVVLTMLILFLGFILLQEIEFKSNIDNTWLGKKVLVPGLDGNGYSKGVVVNWEVKEPSQSLFLDVKLRNGKCIVLSSSQVIMEK